MKVSDCVENIFLGYNCSVKGSNLYNENIQFYDTLTIGSVNNGFVNQKQLKEFNTATLIDEKFLTRKFDIIICCKQPYNIILIKEDFDENILIPNNFIILRNINIKPNFLYNYLICMKDRLNIQKRDNGNENLTKTDIEDIEIPELSIELENKLDELSSRINARQRMYNELVDNDKELIETLFRKEGAINYER